MFAAVVGMLLAHSSNVFFKEVLSNGRSFNLDERGGGHCLNIGLAEEGLSISNKHLGTIACSADDQSCKV